MGSLDDVGGWCPVCRVANRPGFDPCPVCGSALVDELPPVPPKAARRRLDDDLPHDVVEYDLHDWTPEQREELNLLLRGEEVAYGWERGVLTVPIDTEAVVDALVDAIDGGVSDEVVSELGEEWSAWEPASRTPTVASGWRRFAGFLVDVVADIGMSLVVFIALGLAGADVGPTMVLSNLVVQVLHPVIGVGRWGRTFGKLALGTKVVRAGTTELPGWGRAIVRWAVVAVPPVAMQGDVLGWLGLVWVVAVYLPVGFGDHRGIHDRIAGTEVLRV